MLSSTNTSNNKSAWTAGDSPLLETGSLLSISLFHEDVNIHFPSKIAVGSLVLRLLMVHWFKATLDGFFRPVKR
jgi:hypothetical protein